jgi:hypothetical protein
MVIYGHIGFALLVPDWFGFVVQYLIIAIILSGLS